jgi:hypothetical protein
MAAQPIAVKPSAILREYKAVSDLIKQWETEHKELKSSDSSQRGPYCPDFDPVSAGVPWHR